MQFVPGPLGTYMVNVIPLCDGEECSPCQVLIVVKKEAPACTCGQWSDLDHDGRPEVRVEGKLVDCGGETVFSPEEITGAVTIDPGYNCGGDGCGSTLYAWSISGPSGYSHGSGDSLVRGPIEFEPRQEGTYMVAITPHCGDQKCSACEFRIHIRETKQPDLIIERIQPSTDNPRPGEPFDVEITVANRGNGNAGPFLVELASVSQKKSKTVSGLSASGSMTLTFPDWVCRGSQILLTATADTRKEISETDERNNVYTYAVWEFGTFEGGKMLFVSGDIPRDLIHGLQQAKVTHAEKVSSTVPRSVEFALDLTRSSGTLRGAFPQTPAVYKVVYGLSTDTDDQITGALSVLIRVEGAPGGKTVVMPVHAICKNCGRTPSELRDVQITIDEQETRLAPFELEAREGEEITLRAPEVITTADGQRAVFAGWSIGKTFEDSRYVVETPTLRISAIEMSVYAVFHPTHMIGRKARQMERSSGEVSPKAGCGIRVISTREV
jgi:hypothetical protein